ncbi:CAP domain-containing protein [Streptomyces sp. DSM 110735]|uniref:CAP domain-containing protein n=1 Tax=Streptomyces sp. DSM 110735 TaxID=2775031 RepID=UPI0018F60AFD|nr:CAP domain-containing protein [Streptomyces sp. DSM 110735]MBJ7904679.1 CAP domain-containing protein [Streptomyces sp. DSM 110735]
MGRHRRAGAGSDTPHSYAGGRESRGTAPYLNPEAYSVGPRGPVYLTGDEPMDGRGSQKGRRRAKKAATPVRTGLLGVSAAVAFGTAAVGAGVVPGLQNYRLGSGASAGEGEQVQAADLPGNAASEQGGAAGSADTQAGDGAATGGQSTRPAAPAPTPSDSDTSPAPAPAKPKPSAPSQSADKPAPAKPKPSAPSDSSSKPAAKDPSSSASAAVSAQADAEAQVLALVNQERAKVGCTPVTANTDLTKLAEAFSGDMAARDFFDHTDPDGATPWDRASKAGITGLGGENIARGQTDPAAVMEAWMNSPGHRANILNCDFKTLGVGVHFGEGGPWWTQDFGY